jgi:WD40 repeat protein
LVDLKSGHRIAAYKGSSAATTTGAVLSRDGLRVATFYFDGRLEIFDSGTGDQIVRLRASLGVVKAAAFSPDGLQIATASDDGIVRLWSVDSGAFIAEFRGHEKPVFGIAFAPDGRHILTVGADNAVRIWGADFPFNEMNKRLRFEAMDREAYVSQSFILKGSDHDQLQNFEISLDGKLVLTWSQSNDARLWDIQTGTELRLFKAGDELPPILSDDLPPLNVLFSAAMSLDGTRVVTVVPHGDTQLWDATTGARISLLDKAAVARFSPDGTRLITGSSEGVKTWDSEDGKAKTVFHRIGIIPSWPSVEDLTFSGNGSRVFAVGTARTTRGRILGDARMWSIEGQFIRSFHFSDIPARISVSRDGSRLFTMGVEQDLLWDPDRGDSIGTLLHPGGRRWAIFQKTRAEFSSDGHFLATAYDDTYTGPPGMLPGGLDRIRIWDPQTGQLLRVLDGHTKSVNDVRFSPDGVHLVTASDDGTARIWDVQTGLSTCVLAGHEREVRTAEFSPDGMRVVTSSKDGTARLWNIEACSELGIVARHRRELWSASFDKGGVRILTTSSDLTARLWPILPGGKGLIEFAKTSVPRCLTPEERGMAHLDEEPPEWCIELKKAPYDNSVWGKWLDDKRANKNPPMPRP